MPAKTTRSKRSVGRKSKRRHKRRQTVTPLMRFRVFEALAEASNAAEPAIADMQRYVDWIATGAMPAKLGKPALRAVEGGRA